MRNLFALLLGIAIAACAAKAQKSAAPASATMAPEPTGVMSPRSEIDALDAEITARMGELGISRQEATTMAAPIAGTCAPASTEACTEVCTLKDSICKNAARICDLAAQLGGADAYANEKCTSGNASCEAAKQRCCSCM